MLDEKLKKVFKNIDKGWDIADLVRHYHAWLSYHKISVNLESNAYKFWWENSNLYSKEDYKKAELKYCALKLEELK